MNKIEYFFRKVEIELDNYMYEKPDFTFEEFVELKTNINEAVLSDDCESLIDVIKTIYGRLNDYKDKLKEE